MRSQTGARFIKRQRAANRDTKTVCTQHVKRESKLTLLPNGAVSRKQKTHCYVCGNYIQLDKFICGKCLNE